MVLGIFHKCRSKLPAFTPIRIEHPLSTAVELLFTLCEAPMFPGLIQHAAPAQRVCSSSIMKVSATTGIGIRVTISLNFAGGLIWARHSNDVGTFSSTVENLFNGSSNIGSIGICHGLNCDRSVAANRHRAYHNLPSLFSYYFLVISQSSIIIQNIFPCLWNLFLPFI